VDGLTRRGFISRAGAGVLVAGMGGGLAACGESGGDGGGGEQGAVKIGLLTSMSGVFADFGRVMSEATTLAVDRINDEGGLDGRRIEILREDDKGEPGVGAQRARRLLLQEQVDILVGTVSSAVTLAVLPLAERSNKPFIYTVDRENFACKPGGGVNPLVFGLGDTPYQRQSKYVPYAVRKFGRRWFLLGNDYVFPRSTLKVTKDLLEQAGGTVVGETYTPLGTSDYLPIVRNIRRTEADVVFAVVPGTDGVAFIKQARESGLFDAMTITGVATFAAEIYPGMARYAEGVYTVDRYTEELDNAANKRFVADYKERFSPRTPIGPAAAATYGSFLMLQQGQERAKGVTPEAIRKGLEGLAMEIPLGDVELETDTHLLRQHEYVLQIRDRKFEIVEDLGPVSEPASAPCGAKQ
jgi:urea transport system substrate-binding protein